MKNKYLKFCFCLIVFVSVLSIFVYFKMFYNTDKLSAKDIDYPITTEYKEITTLDSVKEEFSLNGTATWKDNWILLTPAKTFQAGNVYLNNKIQLDTDFRIEGKLAITFKGKGQTINGDGIGMGFHTGDVNQLGGTGGSMGVIGLPNALSLVLDTYRNSGEPEVPYIGIWTTNAGGAKTTNYTQKANLDTTASSKPQEVSYSFKYTAADRIIIYQVYIGGVPFFSGNGYELQVPSTFTEYSFFISAATGSRYNDQYASIESASIPMLVTNTPTVVYEEVTEKNVKLILKNAAGIAYPEGSIVYVNGTSYTVDTNSSIIIPTENLGDLTVPLKISAKSFKYANGKKFDGAKSKEISYMLNNIDITITSTASDNQTSDDSVLITGTATPGAYIRISDVPINSSVTPATNVKNNTIASPISSSSIPEFTANFTVKADAEGNYSYRVPSGNYFSAGSIIRVYALLEDGRHKEITQTVLDKTPPTGEGITYHVALNSSAPTPEKLVKNVQDTNPVPQTFTYVFNSETAKDKIDEYIKKVGEYPVKVDVSDNAGNKTTILSKLIVEQADQFVSGSDITVEYKDIKNLSEEELKSYLLAQSKPEAYKLVNGEKIDLSSFVKVSELGSLNDMEMIQAKTYPVTLSVDPSDAQLPSPIETTIQVTVINVDALLTVQFVNEVNTVLSELTFTAQVGETVDLTSKQELSAQLSTFLTTYALVSRPVNETAVNIDYIDTTVQYQFKGIVTLTSVPEKLDFGKITYNALTHRIEAPTFDTNFIITDTRVDTGSGWYLTATLKKAMLNSEGHELVNALRYVSNGKETILSEDAQVVQSKRNAGTGSFDISKEWGTTANTDGIKLQINSSDRVYTGDYVGIITWKIMEGQP